jgi:hypothetical protein
MVDGPVETAADAIPPARRAQNDLRDTAPARRRRRATAYTSTRSRLDGNHLARIEHREPGAIVTIAAAMRSAGAARLRGHAAAL